MSVTTMPNEIVWTIVVAAGSGARFGSPKQFAMLGDRRVLDWSVATASAVSAGVIVRDIWPVCGRRRACPCVS